MGPGVGGRFLHGSRAAPAQHEDHSHPNRIRERRLQGDGNRHAYYLSGRSRLKVPMAAMKALAYTSREPGAR
jgi:hypothetical protein